MLNHKHALDRLRQICDALPGTSEVVAWGHPNFKVANRTFAAFEKYKGQWAIAFKAERAHQEFLVGKDEQFYLSPYAGKHGWVSMKLDPGVDWAQVRALVNESYRLTVAKRPPATKRRSKRKAK
jgi:predicted DNA-binding protein (MmcQ/YjbR family)